VRPVNLIPPDERRDKAPIRTGPIAYLLVGALALALGAVTLLVLTGNKISDRKAEITDLQQQEAATRAQADQLAPFANFASVEQQRTATIKSLADSRFDWERVMHELALVIPTDVWLTNLTGTVGTASGETSESSSIDTASIAGPSLHLTGCASGHDAVAGFLSALRDIDGVTRVGLASSERPTTAAAAPTADAATAAAGGGGSDDCRTRDFITKFDIVAAFDGVPTPAVPGAAPTTPAPAPATPPTEATPASTTAP
jgi:Tfp pilus assembly protein PilN